MLGGAHTASHLKKHPGVTDFIWLMKRDPFLKPRLGSDSGSLEVLVILVQTILSTKGLFK